MPGWEKREIDVGGAPLTLLEAGSGVYTKVSPGQGTDSQFSESSGPLLDVLCSEDFHPEELENNGDTS